MTGPTSVRRSDGSPMTSSSMAPAIISSTGSAISSCRNNRRSAEQRWPALMNAELTTSSTTCSGRAVESTIMAFRPPVSAISGTIAPPRAATLRLMVRAVAVEPVIATPASAGCASAISPNRRPRAGTRCTACGGTPASCSSLTKRAAISGVGSAGFATTALPAASAAVTWPAKIASGKFHGLMQANTPRPCSDSSFNSPVGPSRRAGAANCLRARSA